MKAYTDLEQSKKLAEILPLESADTIWNLTNPDLLNIRAIPYESSDYNNKYLNIIPAWSLAALLDILNKGAYFINENGMAEISSFKSVRWSASILNCGKIEDCYADNPVDACYEMIIKLREQNIL